ncbi:MAG TPA: hypothetical protein VM285_11890, partial [Polyangia bacterium]|nr:hypothetical protein [Polyangia bacterium]
KGTLLLAAAALLVLGCSTVRRGPTVTGHQSQDPAVAPLQVAAVEADPGTPAPANMVVESRRPSQHAQDVHSYWAQKKASVNKANTEGLGKVNHSAKQDREMREMIENKKKATIMGDLDSPGMTNIMSDKMKREAQQMIKGMRQSVMNSLDEPHGTDVRRVDLEMRDVNTARMNGAGLVGMQPHDRFISNSECPNNRCVNGAAGSSGRMRSLGNEIDP